MLLLLSASLYVSAAQGQDYSPETMVLYVYSKGSGNVEYGVEPDPALAQVNASPPGEPCLDALVVDPDGVIMDWDPVDGGVEVDSQSEQLSLQAVEAARETDEFEKEKQKLMEEIAELEEKIAELEEEGGDASELEAELEEIQSALD